MKILAWGAAVGAVAALVACGGSGGGNGGAGGGAGGSATTSSTTTTTTTSVSSSSGTTTTTGTGGGSAVACGITWEDPSDATRAGCETCMEDNCCTEMQNCATGTMCGTWYSCVTACADGDSACSDACTNSNMQGLTDYQALVACYDNQCQKTQDCEYPICDSMLLYPNKDCADCLGGDTTCCGALTACAADQTCAACAAAPDTAGCDSNSLYTPVGTCFDNTCGKQCMGSICGSKLGYPDFNSCNYCLTQSCCTSFDACIADMNSTCYKCVTGATSGAACDADTNFKAFTMCRDVTCAADCGG